MKLGIALNDELVKRIDNVAEENYMSRSGFITLACNQYLNSLEVASAIKNLSFCMSKIAESNEIDEETKKQLDDFMRITKIISGQ